MTQFETLIIEIPYRENSEDYFARLKPLKQRIWLDSGRPQFTSEKFDILSAKPSKVLVNPSITQIESEVSALANNTFLSFLEKHSLPFWGGAVGYFNYEYNAAEFGLHKHQDGQRDSVFGIFEWALIQNHEEHKSVLVFVPSATQEIKQSVTNLVTADTKATIGHFKVDDLKQDTKKTCYKAAFSKIDDYIHAGDAYQINFSQRFSGRFSGDPDAAYSILRNVLPSPHSAYLELGEDTVLSFSPERFIEIHNGLAKTQPIKGTAPRDSDKTKDKNYAEELQSSEKNRAENVMIVDLLRNDFSKSCEPFSVKVSDLFSLQSFANVHHLVSTVTGVLKNNVSPLTFFMRCFPGGSITGAPKKRAMEIIQELEAFPRNIYCGSVCYLSVNGRFDSSITIRTLLISEDTLYCWGGGGIVADSDPEGEYQESLQKVNILIDTLKAQS